MSATTGMVNAGWPEDSIFECLLRRPGGASLQRRIDDGWSISQTRKWFETYTLARSKERVAASPQVAAPEDSAIMIEGLRRWSRVHRWPGRAGLTDRTVYEHLLQLAARLHCSHSLGASSREVAEAIGVDRSTATRSLRRLRDLGLLARVFQEETKTSYGGPLSPRYSFKLPTFSTEEERNAYFHEEGALAPQSYPRGCEGETGAQAPDETIGHDAFRSGGLGKAAHRTYRLLTDEAQSVRSLASAADRGMSTVRRNLKVLESRGLAVNNDGHWSIAQGVDLNAVAEAIGSAGLGERQRAKHLRERRRAREKSGSGRVDVPTCLRFVREMVLATPGHSTSERELTETFHRWLLTLRSADGPRSSRRFSSALWPDLIDEFPMAKRITDVDGPRWEGVGLRSRTLPHLPRPGPAIAFDETTPARRTASPDEQDPVTLESKSSQHAPGHISVHAVFTNPIVATIDERNT